MSNVMKDMAQILAIGQLAGPAAAKQMIGNIVKKSIIEDTEAAIKRLSDAQQKELEKTNEDSSTTTSTTDTTDAIDITNNEQSQNTSEVGQNFQSDINDTVKISQSAQKALKFEST